LASINVNDKTEKKQNLTYLSWAWAVDQLLREDPGATWTYAMGKEVVSGPGEPPVLVDVPYVRIGMTAMVFCTVRAFDIERTAQLPVMDHRNKAIPNPDSFQVNTAMQRCLAKAIALHGLGLYIYAGEDLPYEDAAEPPKPKATAEEVSAARAKLSDCETREELRETYAFLSEELKAITKEFVVALAKSLPNKEAA
jgi:hypothetical protein